MAAAFVDRAPIDWASLLGRPQPPADRLRLEQLRSLERIREPAPAVRPVPGGTPGVMVAIACLVALAAIQIAWAAVAAGAALVSGNPLGGLTSSIVLMLAFASAGLLLVPSAGHDRRGLFLLATFAFASSAFSRPALVHLSHPWLIPPGWLLQIYPEAFAPAALWQFAVRFPHVRRFTAFDVLARRTTGAMWALGIVLFGANLSPGHAAWPDYLLMLGRDHPGNAFWHLFVLAVVPALATILIRSRRAPPAERRKVARFAIAIAAGAAPLLLTGLARMTVPPVDDWLKTAGSWERAWLDRLLLGTLTSLPILTSVAVLVDRPFEPASLFGKPLRHWMLRGLVTALVCAPFATVLVSLYRVRHTSLAEVVSGPRILLVLACAGAGCVLLAARGRLLTAIERRTQTAVRHKERLALALDRVRMARDVREIGMVLERELRQALGAATVRLLVPGSIQRPGASTLFEDPYGRVTPLAADSALAAVLRKSPGPLDLSADGTLAAMFPAPERHWLLVHGITLAAAVKRREGTIAAVVVIGTDHDGPRVTRHDRWFVATLMTAVATAWEADALHRTPGDEAAFECGSCGLVAESWPIPCACGSEAGLALLPRRLGGKFTVERRVGAGGMGVVYVARDAALGREVALKTLPDLRDGRVDRLQDEAHAMAAMNHEAVATIYGLELWRRTPVLVMEYFPHGTLARRLARGPLPIRDGIALGIRLAEALSYMHGRGMLHRDLKPSNIAFTATDAPKLLDFGLATLIDPSGAPARDRGNTPVVGTRGYLPPEARTGGSPGPSLDLWALGIVLFETLHGRHPFEPQDLVRASQPALVTAFFARALARDPSARFQTSDEVLAELRAIAEDVA